jgi:hypothetical protein
MEIDLSSQPNQTPPSTEPVEEIKNIQRNRFDKKKWLILGAAVVIVFTLFFVFFADISPTQEAVLPTKELIFSTPIADFTYTYTDEKTNYMEFEKSTYTASTGSVFLVIELTPVNGKNLSSNVIEKYPFSDTQVMLGDSTYEMHYITWKWSADGQLTNMVFVFIVDENNKDKAVKLV